MPNEALQGKKKIITFKFTKQNDEINLIEVDNILLLDLLLSLLLSLLLLDFDTSFAPDLYLGFWSSKPIDSPYINT